MITQFLSTSVLQWTRRIMLLTCLVAVGGYAWMYSRLPQPAPVTTEAAPPAPLWPAPYPIPDSDWAVFRQPRGVSAPNLGPLAARFRLAGTFFGFGNLPGEQRDTMRSAILDDLQKGEQHLVKEGDAIEDIEVVRIFPDRIILRTQGEDQELWLSFSGAKGDHAPKTSESTDPLRAEDQPAIETSRFGKRVGANRWVLKRDVLMEYYNELLDDPERLALLYLSMKPDYKEDDIEGYRIAMEGENEFFEAAGLEEGDVVRRVNSMRMTSQARAEYFIREFVNDRMGVLVFDVERSGDRQKLIYLIR